MEPRSMHEKLDKAIEKMTEMVAANAQADNAIKFSQAALNLAHAKQILEAVNKTSK